MRREAALRGRTLVAARRCLDAIEASAVPGVVNATALARVMAAMAGADADFCALMNARLANTPLASPRPDAPAAYGRSPVRIARVHH